MRISPTISGWLVKLRSRREGCGSAWWIAFLGAWGALAGLVLWCPEPCSTLLRVLPDGILVTFQITIAAIVLAVLLGLITGLGRIAGNRFFSTIASTYVEVVQGIPLLVQLLLFYYGLAQGLQVPDIAAAIVAIGFCYGVPMAEVVRAATENVARDQADAARALGFNAMQTSIHVVLPQAWRAMLPPFGREAVALLKDTSLVSVLAVADVTHLGHEFAAESCAHLETYTLVALLYLLITLILGRLVRLLDAGVTDRVRA